jgi:heat shock protein HslJ
MNNRFGILSSLVAVYLSLAASFVLTGDEHNGASATQPVALDAVEWRLTEINGQPARAAVEGKHGLPTLRFNAEKKQVNGFSGVNRFFGNYKQEGEKLMFLPLASTRMAGPPEAMKLEGKFLAMLHEVTQFRIGKGTLELLQNGKILARFAATATATE